MLQPGAYERGGNECHATGGPTWVQLKTVCHRVSSCHPAGALYFMDDALIFKFETFVNNFSYLTQLDEV